MFLGISKVLVFYFKYKWNRVISMIKIEEYKDRVIWS